MRNPARKRKEGVKMAKYYKLIDAENSVRIFNLPHRESGKNVYKYRTLHPGDQYTVYADDPVFVKALKEDAYVFLDYTEERKKALDACNARYEIQTRTCCGGRKKIKVWLVEVVE